MKWFKLWQERRNRAEYFRGYDYAAGVLLRNGDYSIGDLLSEAENAFDRAQFDFGIESAVRDYRQLGR